MNVVIKFMVKFYEIENRYCPTKKKGEEKVKKQGKTCSQLRVSGKWISINLLTDIKLGTGVGN